MFGSPELDSFIPVGTRVRPPRRDSLREAGIPGISAPVHSLHYKFQNRKEGNSPLFRKRGGFRRKGSAVRARPGAAGPVRVVPGPEPPLGRERLWGLLGGAPLHPRRGSARGGRKSLRRIHLRFLPSPLLFVTRGVPPGAFGRIRNSRFRLALRGPPLLSGSRGRLSPPKRAKPAGRQRAEGWRASIPWLPE